MEKHKGRESVLKSLGMKATPKRLAMLAALESARVYKSPEDVWRALRRKFTSIGLPTVYRNLEELEKGGIISKVMHSNRQLYYFFCRHKAHHHHFVCISCRKVQDFASCAEKEIEKEIKTSIRGRVVSHILQVNGFCEECVR